MTTGRGAVRANAIKEVKKGIMKIYGYLLQLAAFNSITGIASPNKYLIDAIRNAQFEKKANWLVFKIYTLFKRSQKIANFKKEGVYMYSAEIYEELNKLDEEKNVYGVNPLSYVVLDCAR